MILSEDCSNRGEVEVFVFFLSQLLIILPYAALQTAFATKGSFQKQSFALLKDTKLNSVLKNSYSFSIKANPSSLIKNCSFGFIMSLKPVERWHIKKTHHEPISLEFLTLLSNFTE